MLSSLADDSMVADTDLGDSGLWPLLTPVCERVMSERVRPAFLLDDFVSLPSTDDPLGFHVSSIDDCVGGTRSLSS